MDCPKGIHFFSPGSGETASLTTYNRSQITSARDFLNVDGDDPDPDPDVPPIPEPSTFVLLGFGVDVFFSPFPLIKGLGQMVWSSSNSATLIAIPFFVLLGEILVRSGVAARTYEALDRWVSWLPGGLVHANVATSTMFSAISGSSVATAATVANVKFEKIRPITNAEVIDSNRITSTWPDRP